MAKKLLFVLLSIFLTYQTYNLVVAVVNASVTEFNPLATVTVGFALNLFTTGIFAFPGFVFPTNKVLGTKYYTIKHQKVLKKVYKLMYVDVFRKLLLFFFWGRGKNKTKYFNGTRKGLSNFSYQSRQSEFGHLMAFICVSAINCVLILYGHYGIVLASTIINVIGNLYPIVLQRHHRVRIDKVISVAWEQSEPTSVNPECSGSQITSG